MDRFQGDDGFFSIDVIEEGNYFISVSAIGYHKESTEIFQLNKGNSPLNIESIIVRENVEQLDEVVVRRKAHVRAKN